jgi:hypothetical protein
MHDAWGMSLQRFNAVVHIQCSVRGARSVPGAVLRVSRKTPSAQYSVFSVSVFRRVSRETRETASETHAIPEAGLRRTLQRFNPSTVQRCRLCSVFSVQFSEGFPARRGKRRARRTRSPELGFAARPTIQRFNDSTVQRFNGSTVQRPNASTLVCGSEWE